VDYEHVPFRCYKYHEHGHLFTDCPLNNTESRTKATVGKDTDGFHKVGNRSKGGKRLQKKTMRKSRQARTGIRY